MTSKVDAKVLLTVFALAVVAACGNSDTQVADEPGPQPESPEEEESAGVPGYDGPLTIYFIRDGEPVAVEREAPVPSPGLAPSAAVMELVRGPTPEEEAEGITSWFSPETADLVRAVSMGGDGQVLVDFHAELRDRAPGATSSMGAELVLMELNETLFQFPDVQSVEYTIDGSCEAFWNWLEYECQIVSRQE